MKEKIIGDSSKLPKQKFDKDMLEPVQQKLLKLCFELQLSVRINSKNGCVNLYEDLGEFENVEQAWLYLRQLKERNSDI